MRNTSPHGDNRYTNTSVPWRSAPFGFCIYGSNHNTDDLSEEHVIPFGLGGNIILEEASCPDCRKETGKFEQTCLRGLWGMHRAHANVRTRHPKERPTHGTVILRPGGPPPAAFRRPDRPGMAFELVDPKDISPAPGQTHSVPLADHPHFLLMPVFDASPAVLMGSTEPTGIKFATCFDRAALDRLMPLYGRNAVAIDTPFGMRAFHRLLAKIAHGMMVATYDMAAIRPLLLDIILNGNVTEAWRYIGQLGEFRAKPHLRGGPGYHVEIGALHSADGRIVIGVTIQLFAQYGTPTYLVVAGEADAIPSYRPDGRLDVPRSVEQLGETA